MESPATAPSGGADPLPAPLRTAPVARRGIAFMLALLVTVLVVGFLLNSRSQPPGRALLTTLGNLGFRSPPIALYTLLLLSPIFFESAYPWLARRASGRGRRVVENLHAHAPYLIVIALVMLVMRLENALDLSLTAALGLDFTPAIWRFEGDLVGPLQSWMRSWPLNDVRMPLYGKPLGDSLFIFVYVTLYALYHVVAIFGFAVAGLTGMVKRFTVAWTTVYAVALPFYLFAPVNEVWTTNVAYCDHYGYTEVEGLLNDDCGASGGIVLAIASINNCFPSLHNAFAWTLPFLLLRSGWRRLGWAASGFGLLITVSTVYLGIHWITDIVPGIALAWFATSLSLRLDYGLTHELRLTSLRWARRRAEP